MGLRPAKCYRKLERPYTRYSKKKPRRSYVKTVPDKRIHRFEMGNKKKKDFPLRGKLVVEQAVQIRHNALEAARVSASKIMNNEVGAELYFMKVLVYPHHVIRENALATGAGADRFQTGMRKAFGKAVSSAAQVRSNQSIIEIRTNKNKIDIVKRALKLASRKIPSKCRIEFIENQALLHMLTHGTATMKLNGGYRSYHFLKKSKFYPKNFNYLYRNETRYV